MSTSTGSDIASRWYRYPKKLIEAMQGRQILVQVTEVVFAELPGSIALYLQGRRDGRSLARHADIGPGLAHGRSPVQMDHARL